MTLHLQSADLMKRLVSVFVLLFSIHQPQSGYAQTPLESADTLFDLLESTLPELFPQAQSTLEADAADAHWWYREYPTTSTIVAVNNDDGYLWALSPSLGSTPMQLMPIDEALALVLELAAPAGGANAITNQGNGICEARVVPPAGTFARWEGWEIEGIGIATFLNGFSSIALSDLEFETRRWQERTDPFNNLTSNSVTSTAHRQIAGDMLLITKTVNEMHYKHSFNIEYSGSFHLIITENNITYSPGLLLGPATALCEGQMWYNPEVSETITPIVNGNLMTAIATNDVILESLTVVISVSEQLNTPVGPFTTVKTKVISANGYTVNWTDVVTGVVVKTESYSGEKLELSLKSTIYTLEL